ncbi:MAG: hypothetical protein IKA69_06600 [Kiritimatiellae bacterium]|nr:hypothetical protein [Kiritimatiellia bacterium]
MNKFLLCMLCVLCGLNLIAQDTNGVIAATLYADGTTNTWTQADLVDALGLMNRKYHRDMASESGRRQWHGKRLQQYVTTNALGRIYGISLYEDGYVHQIEHRATGGHADPEAAAKERERAEAIKAAWEAANLPPEIAELRARQRAAGAEN